MLEVRDIDAYYGQIRALERVTLEVRQGEIVAIIGPNGAGKTTLLRTISGLMHPHQGQILFDGKDIGSLSAEKIVSLGISHVPERRQIFGTLSVLDNLFLGAYHRRSNARAVLQRDLDFVFGLFPILGERQHQRGGTLSGGEQQMLAVARGLMSKPRLLLLDEPSLGLAPLIVREIVQVVCQLRQEGCTILLVEQNARAALKAADRAYVLETGKVAVQGLSVDLLADHEVQRAYLGQGRKSSHGS